MRLLSILALLVAPASLAQPTHDYLPLVPGEGWVYVNTEDDRGVEYALYVSEKRTLEGTTCFAVQHSQTDALDGEPHTEDLWCLDPDGVTWASHTSLVGEYTMDSASHTLLSADLSPGIAWAGKEYPALGLNDTVVTVEGTEAVTTPAGTFEAIKVAIKIRGGRPALVERWYARGVGMVRERTHNTSFADEAYSRDGPLFLDDDKVLARRVKP